MFDYMYFPENKMEYIPSFIIVAIFFIIAFITVRIIMRQSKKEEEKARLIEKQFMENKIDKYN